MKLFILSIFAVITFYYKAPAQTGLAKDLAGSTWEGTDGAGKKGKLVFIDATTLIINIEGKGSAFATYTIDDSMKPALFDIIIRQGENSSLVKCLLLLLPSGKLKWQLTETADRAKGFIPETDDNTLLLARIR